MRPRLFYFLLLVSLMALGIIVGMANHPVHAQAGSCCASDWKLPLPAGRWKITQGDRDSSSCTSHCAPPYWEVNLYALDIVSADEGTIGTMGAPVLAPADGKVIAEFWDGYGGGNVLKIEHGSGGPVSVYLHLSSYIAALNKEVQQRDPVARIGNSTTEANRGMGAHLHLTVLKSVTEKVGLKITSWDGNTNFSTNATIISSNGSGSSTSTPAPSAPVKPVLSQPENNSTLPETTEVNLSWNTSANASQYKVELWGGQYSGTMVPCDWQSGASCRIGRMLPGIMNWHVRDRNSSGQESDWSDTWTFTIQGPTPTPTFTPAITLTPRPQAPTAPSLRGPANNTNLPQSTDIWFEWNQVSDASQYYLEYWGGPYSTLTSNWIYDTAYHVGNMWPGTYSWHVKARNSGIQESNWSDAWTFTIQGPTPTPTFTPTITLTPRPQAPAAPSLRGPANNTNPPQSTDIWFEWNQVSDANQYYLEYWGGPYSTLTSDWIYDTAYHVGTMWPGTYSWHVKARNSGAQESNWSDTWTFTIPQPSLSTDTPQPPTITPQPSFTGNIAPRSNRSPDGINSGNAFDSNLSTFWTDGLGHRFSLELRLPDPLPVTRILVWDRPQNSPDNNQINAIIIRLSNGMEKRFGMDSQGARCIDVSLTSPQTIFSVTLVADDASGNNGLSEVEIWVGSKQGGPTCSNTSSMP